MHNRTSSHATCYQVAQFGANVTSHHEATYLYDEAPTDITPAKSTKQRHTNPYLYDLKARPHRQLNIYTIEFKALVAFVNV